MLNRLVRERLESAFPLCWVSGEISNLVLAASGHAYFTLKDASAQVRCVMFRSRVQLLGWRLENGQKIEARTLVTLYEARGDFQLNVETARKAGIGNLYEQFLRRKEKLEREGLFANESKRSLPRFPRRIGIISSPQAAALRDVLITLTRRAPQVSAILYPTPVQGEGAGDQIATALQTASRRGECDVVIVCRGGGSLEDLWAFNEEVVARAIRASTVPVITGIGHETDFTIADFAADQRAPTPTAGAEIAAPQRRQLLENLTAYRDAMTRRTEQGFERRYQQLDWLSSRLKHPSERLALQRGNLDHLRRRLASCTTQAVMQQHNTLVGLKQRLLAARPEIITAAHHLEVLASRLQGEWQKTLNTKSISVGRLADSLEHLNPRSVLARGYSIVSDKEGAILRDCRSLEPNAPITVFFHRGRADARVTSVTDDPADVI
ncbi:exodeoxyribonuclease VII large subunit [Propionivibrio limicola]|uniref:exodeoxyribonuclease VII large subunit n=1 Tax=Propionivibrio limicola TaxID=167645 RepID=UPI001FE7F222|nr:exodeoxyribonuclease VII large subunit [Propionivibrio limicola]